MWRYVAHKSLAAPAAVKSRLSQRHIRHRLLAAASARSGHGSCIILVPLLYLFPRNRAEPVVCVFRSIACIHTNRSSVECCFPYVCPEPVLVKCSFLCKNGDDLGIHLSLAGIHSSRGPSRGTCAQNGLFLSAFLCLSRACLGKMIVLMHKLGGKTVFSPIDEEWWQVQRVVVLPAENRFSAVFYSTFPMFCPEPVLVK
jgi:hypothetical protein